MSGEGSVLGATTGVTGVAGAALLADTGSYTTLFAIAGALIILGLTVFVASSIVATKK